MTRRRHALIAAAGAAATLAHAGTPRRRRVAIVFTDSPVERMRGPQPAHPMVRGFLGSLQALGWRDGVEVDVERWSAEGRPERLLPLMREVVAGGAEVIVTSSAGTAARATSSVPIVGPVLASDPIVGSSTRPRGNVTGIDLAPRDSLNAKRLQLLKAAAPTVTRVAFLTVKTPVGRPWLDDTLAAAKALGLMLSRAGADGTEDLPAAFEAIVHERADALVVGSQGVYYANRGRIHEFAVARRLPAIHATRETAEGGGLLAYGASLVDVYRRLAHYVDRILRGARPPDLPVEYPTRFELVVDLRAARAIALVLPARFLQLADEIIE